MTTDYGKFDIMYFKHIAGHEIEITKEFKYTLINGETITVHKGFTSDGLSIPRGFRWIVKPFGKGKKAGVIHDYLYATKAMSRKECDIILLHALYDCDVNPIVAKTMYYAVRSFGWLYY